MSRANLDLVIGRVLQDETFRRVFLSNRAKSVRVLREQGMDLTEEECEKLRTTDWTMWLKLVETMV